MVHKKLPHPDPAATLGDSFNTERSLQGPEWSADKRRSNDHLPEEYLDRHWDAEAGAWVVDKTGFVQDPTVTLPNGRLPPQPADPDAFNFTAATRPGKTEVPISRLGPLPPTGRQERALINGMLLLSFAFVAAAWWFLLS